MPPPTPIGTSDYRLGAGDKMRIEVYRDAQLSQSAQVRPDGKITLPLVGDLEASGKTPAELDDTITLALREYINNPSVTVIVVEAMGSTAYVLGGVNNPGAVQLQGPVTVLQALALAGGLNDFADRKNIRILRKSSARHADASRSTTRTPSRARGGGHPAEGRRHGRRPGLGPCADSCSPSPAASRAWCSAPRPPAPSAVALRR